jgi:Transmembrane amino acid transporter protein
MYPSTSLFIAIGQLAIAILVLFSYPLQVHPCRNCLDKVFHFGSANDKLEDDTVEDEHAPGEMSPLKHTLLTTAVVFGGFSIAYFVDNLEMGMNVHCFARAFSVD